LCVHRPEWQSRYEALISESVVTEFEIERQQREREASKRAKSDAAYFESQGLKLPKQEVPTNDALIKNALETIQLTWNFEPVLCAFCISWAVWCRAACLILALACALYFFALALCAWRRYAHAEVKAKIAKAAAHVLSQRSAMVDRMKKMEAEAKKEASEERNAESAAGASASAAAPEQSAESGIRRRQPAAESNPVAAVNAATSASPNADPIGDQVKIKSENLFLTSSPASVGLHRALAFRAIRSFLEFSLVCAVMGGGLLWLQHVYLGHALLAGPIVAGPRLAFETTGHAEIWSMDFLQGFLCQFIAPSRGLFVFSPFLCLAILGFWQLVLFANTLLSERTEVQSKEHTDALLLAAVTWAERDEAGKSVGGEAAAPSTASVQALFVGIEHDWFSLLPALFAIPVSTMIFSIWYDFHGGWSYGPRLLQDCLPFFVLLLVPSTQFVCQHWKSPKLGAAAAVGKTGSVSGGSGGGTGGARLVAPSADPVLSRSTAKSACWCSSSRQGLAKALAAVFVAGVCIAVAIQYIGAYAYNFREWNARPCSEVKCNLRELPESATKLWDFPDLPDPLTETARTDGVQSYSRFYVNEDDARRVAGKSTRCERLKVMCDVNLPLHRHRIWSVSDSIISYYWRNFDDARRIKEALMENWFVDLSRT
jgi:hypothetical protein